MYREPDAVLHQVVGGRWRLLAVLGATEHGTVYRVEALEGGRPARLELWDPRHVEERGELARFEREARTLSRLHHERCLSVVAFGADKGRPFLVSDLPDGKALRAELGSADLTVDRAVALGVQLCEGLQYLHRHGVVHRALTPDNLWITDSPAADLLKIGLPRLGPTASAARTDHRADLYAAGLLLYAMCTGRELGEGAASGAPIPAPRSVSPERGISDDLEQLILRAVAPAREVRFGTADELLAALQSVGARPAVPKRRPAVAKRRPAQSSRQRTALIAAAVAAVAVVGAGALRSRGGQAPAPAPAAPIAAVTPPPGAVPPLATAKPPSPRPAPPPPPVATTAPPAVEPKPVAIAAPPAAEPKPVAIAAPPAVGPKPVAAQAEAPSHDERREIWSLLDRGQLDEGAARIKALAARDPDAAWPELALGVLYYRKYWRRDAVRHWQAALEQDREIRHDPQFGAYLCFMLDDDWKAAGVTQLLAQLRAEAVPLLESCVASAKTPRLRAQASHTLDDLRRARRARP